MYLRGYQDLDVWKKSIILVKQVYAIADTFPKHEIYGLSAQLRRAAVSVPSNIAEGRGRRRTREFLKHIDIAFGSLAEVETQLFIAHELSYITAETLQKILDLSSEIGRMLNGLLQGLEKKLTESPLPSLNAEC